MQPRHEAVHNSLSHQIEPGDGSESSRIQEALEHYCAFPFTAETPGRGEFGIRLILSLSTGTLRLISNPTGFCADRKHVSTCAADSWGISSVAFSSRTTL